jgi:hypothetical protein
MKVKIRNKGGDEVLLVLEGIRAVEVGSGIFHVGCHASGCSYIGNYSLEDFEFEVIEDE